MTTIAFDLDGTLFDAKWGRKVKYDDEDSLRNDVWSHASACLAVRRLRVQGVRVVYITGRNEKFRAITAQCIRDAIGHDPTPDELRMNGPWKGYEHMSAWKATQIRELGAILYVGDQLADFQAAKAAGVQFQYATEFHMLGLAQLPVVAA